MIKHICDRCGGDASEHVFLRFYGYGGNMLTVDGRQQTELCPKCAGDVIAVVRDDKATPGKAGSWQDCGNEMWKCSECGKTAMMKYWTPYCPNCGAKMRI